MATKNIFASMLNQKPVTSTPAIASNSVKVQKAPKSGEFAFIDQNNSIYRHPMQNRGSSISGSAWAKMLNMKGKNHG